MNVCLNVPNIVYQNSWLGQTADLSETSIFTPSQPGMYRATAIAYISTSSSASVSGYLQAGVGTVGFDSYEALYNPEGSPPLASAPAAITFAGVTDALVTINASVGGTFDHYDLYVTIEQLQ